MVLGILLPSVVQFTHIFEDHEHNFCGNVTTHLHEQQLDCDLTKIFIPFGQYYLDEYNILTSTQISEVLHYTYEQPMAQETSQSYLLRGPPTYLTIL